MDNKKTDVTVITACYNSEKTISNTIESVLMQDFESLQYIFIDGGSTDRTLDVINSYKDRFSGASFEIYSEPDDGIYDAMNKGLRLAKGELIGLLNSDDWYEKEALKRVWEVYINNPNKEVIIYGAAKYIRDDKIERVEFLSHEFLSKRMIVHPASFVSKQVYDRIGLFDTSFKIGADWDFMLRAKEKGVEFIPLYYDVFTDFRLGGASSTEDIQLENLRIQFEHNIIGKTQYKWKSFKHIIKKKIFDTEVRLKIIR